jgi:hypothetical protein
MGYTVVLLCRFECAARREGCPDQIPKLRDRHPVLGRLIAHPCKADSPGRNHTSLSIGFDHLLWGGRSLFSSTAAMPQSQPYGFSIHIGAACTKQFRSLQTLLTN